MIVTPHFSDPGAYVDATKRYKTASAAAFCGTVLSLLAVARDRTTRASLDVALLALGFFVGPVQPLAAELAVECTYPDGDENVIVALMQTGGNLASAAAVPLFLAVQKLATANNLESKLDLRVEYFLLALFAAAAALVCGAHVRKADLKRTNANSAHNSHANTPVQRLDLDSERRRKYDSR